jgi:UDP-N-acetylmuramoylalanine--D-glutamate ligase
MNYKGREMITDFTHKRIGVWGLGAVGQSALPFFTRHQAAVTVLDAKTPQPSLATTLSLYGVSFVEQTTTTSVTSFLEQNDYILVSPGIDTRPYQAVYAHKFVSELDLFYAQWHKKTIGITGSVGKTTITHLLSQLMTYAGLNVATGGNIGTPMLDLLALQQQSDCAVLELSSFQLEQSHECAPDVALITNLHPNHLDRHGDMSAYAHAKQQIFKNHTDKSSLVLPYDLYVSDYYREALQNHPGKLYLFSATTRDALVHETFSSNVIFVYALDEHKSTIIRHSPHDGLQTSEVISLTQLPSITMLENWLAICALLEAQSLDAHELITQHGNALTLPEDRMERVGMFKESLFINDSKATIPHATLEACKALASKQILLILGGLSKGVDRSAMIKQLPAHVTTVICFGKEAEQLATWCKLEGKIAYATENLETGMALCKDLIMPGMTILFSPSGSSYDLFTNYHERGMRFKQLVRDLFT